MQSFACYEAMYVKGRLCGIEDMQICPSVVQRIAMLGFGAATIGELFSGKGPAGEVSTAIQLQHSNTLKPMWTSRAATYLLLMRLLCNLKLYCTPL